MKTTGTGVNHKTRGNRAASSDEAAGSFLLRLAPWQAGLLIAALLGGLILLSAAPALLLLPAALRPPVFLGVKLGMGVALLAGAAVFPLQRAALAVLNGARRNAEGLSAERQSLLRREKYLSTLVAIERRLLTGPGDEGLGEILASLGKASGASRLRLYQCHHGAAGMVTATLASEWSGPGVSSGMGNPTLKQFSLSASLPRWRDEFEKDRPISAVVSELPPNERTFLAVWGTLAVLALPLRVQDELWGFLCVDQCTQARSWGGLETDLLTVAVGAIAQAEARRLAEMQTKQLAHNDPLTGLPNRRVLREELESRLDEARRSHAKVALLYLDLDRFKQINDTLGHAFGDRFLLFVVRERLQPCLGASDLLARVGGDEFVLVVSEQEDILSRVAQKAEAILRSLALPISLDGHELVISGSVGIATGDSDADMLLKYADMAMYRAKEEGRGTFRFFTGTMAAATKERFQMEADLRHDLDPRFAQPDTFLLYYQPQVDLNAGRMIGMESLVRWRHARRGLVTPDRFIPLAEESGLVEILGEMVLRRACEQAADWAARGVALRVGVNLSARQMRNRDFPLLVARTLQETGLSPALLDLELTETALLSDMREVRGVMTKLKDMGVRLSLDDFGAGYSSLSHLRECPFDTVKIDRLFVRAIVGGTNDQKLVQALIGVAEALGMEVIAEGVETPAQCDLLRRLGCTRMQGYLFSPPVSATEAETRFLGSALRPASTLLQAA